MRLLNVLIVSTGCALLCGCASYVTPTGRADFTAFTSASMKESFEAKPAAAFPAGIVAVQVQAPHYENWQTKQDGGVYGQGRYSVVIGAEAGEADDLQRLSKLPQVGGFITLSTLLLPDKLESDRELREAAARLKADMVLLYTFDTTFHENDASTALATITLGLSPTRTVSVNVTASALLMDTRTGFIYAAFDAHEKRKLLSNVWESRESADRARQDAEKVAFKGLVGEFEKSWPQILERAQKGG